MCSLAANFNRPFLSDMGGQSNYINATYAPVSVIIYIILDEATYAVIKCWYVNKVF